MVVLKELLPTPAYGEPDNTYWAAGGTRQEISDWKSDHNVYTSKTISADELIRQKTRKSRGLLIYENYTVKELTGFVKSRGLPMPKGRRNKADIMGALEEADDNPQFSKIFELPREMRDRIYFHYMKDLGKLPTLPHQPPLLLASRLIRAEATTSYIEDASFTFRIDLVNPQNRNTLRVDLSADTMALINRIGVEDFQRIKNFRFDCVVVHGSSDRRLDLSMLEASTKIYREYERVVGKVRFWNKTTGLDFKAAANAAIEMPSEIFDRPGHPRVRAADFGLFAERIRRALRGD